nr:unnamed protein product [Callosobruchus chinensis]
MWCDPEDRLAAAQAHQKTKQQQQQQQERLVGSGAGGRWSSWLPAPLGAAPSPAAADRMGAGGGGGHHPQGGHPPRDGPSSLFILSEENIIRRYTRFIIEWPYPFMQSFLERYAIDQENSMFKSFILILT